ncbi:MAG TPA: hypothetical protein VN604_08270 [Nitrospirota bacterium]|nr:hypothetical protein [Nitrospirota bacterium]
MTDQHCYARGMFEDMKTFTIALLSFVLCIASLAYSQSDVMLIRWKFIDDFVDNGISLPITASLADIQALGKVKKIEVEYYDSPHSKTLVLEMRTFHFDGLQIVAHFVKGDDSKAQLSKAIVTGSKWKIHKGLNIGTNVQAVVKALGVPTAKNDASYEYCGATECVIFDIANNKVSKITFSYYLD